MDALHKQKVTVVTFNYDRSLEHYFATHLASSERFSGADWKEVLSVVHVHGALDFDHSRHTDFRIGYAEALLAAATCWQMVDEVDGPHQVALQARRILEDAKRIFVLGFDFHLSNVELLALNRPEVAGKAFALNWDGSVRFRTNAMRSNLTDDHIIRPHEPGAHLEIATAIADGLFDRQI